jgi:hypothetical protein
VIGPADVATVTFTVQFVSLREVIGQLATALP